MEAKERKNNSSTIGGVVFAGCMFLGGGIGMLYGSMNIGGAIGMGVGFIAMAAVMMYFRKKD